MAPTNNNFLNTSHKIQLHPKHLPKHFTGKKVHHILIIGINTCDLCIKAIYKIIQMYRFQVVQPKVSLFSYFNLVFILFYPWYLTIKDYNLTNLRKIYGQPICVVTLSAIVAHQSTKRTQFHCKCNNDKYTSHSIYRFK